MAAVVVMDKEAAVVDMEVMVVTGVKEVAASAA